MEVLVDTSVWIDYFRGGDTCTNMDLLIDENLIVTNDLILAELIPYLKIRKQRRVVEMLHALRRIPLCVRWEELMEFQVKSLRRGENGTGIPDLIIAQKTPGRMIAGSIHLTDIGRLENVWMNGRLQV